MSKKAMFDTASIDTVPDEAAPIDVVPVLQTVGVSVRYGEKSVVDNVDLEVNPGEWLGLVGPNGAGKTSLLHAVVGLIAHTGTVQVGPDGARRPGATDVALVHQSPVRPPGMTVAEYLLLGRTAHLGWLAREGREDRAIVAEVLHRLKLEDLSDRPVTSLSGGEFQRAVLGRALAQATPILLLDEPTSALDLGHQLAVLELVDDLRRAEGLTVIAVMHDLTTAARFADRWALLDAGRLVACDTPNVVAQPELLSQVFGAPLTVRRLDGELVVLPSPRSTRPQETLL